MKKITTALLLVLALTLSVHAQTEAKKEKIKYLFSLMHQDTLLNKTFATMSASMATQMETLLKDSLYKKLGMHYTDEMAKINAKVMETTKAIARKMLNEDMVTIYDKYFTDQDIDDFIAFYKSAAGQKLINKLPDITGDIMTIMSTKTQPAIQQSVKETIDEFMRQTESKSL